MNEELKALELNNTWELTPLPPGKKPIACKWIFKTKYKADGSKERDKARLVVLGNKQQYGIDYAETFAPVAKLTTVRSLLEVVALEGWHAHQMDVKNAFLHGDLHETVFMKPPPSYIAPNTPLTTGQGELTSIHHTSPNLVCKLNKALYGLKQAPRQWFTKLSTSLIAHGFTQSKVEYSLFTKSSDNSLIVVLVYVDDLILPGNNATLIQETKALLSGLFHMKDLGPLS